MSNTLLTPLVIAGEALMVLENELVMANLVHRDFSKEFQKVGNTVTIRGPASFTATAFSTTVAAQNITESSVQIVLDQLLDVSMAITAQELSTSIVDFSMQTIQPAMRAIAQQVDGLLTALYANVASHQIATSTAVVTDITNLRAQLNLRKCPMSDRNLVFGPATEARYLPLDAFLHADKKGDTKAIRDANMGRVLGFDCYMDQNIVYKTSTVLDAAGAMKGAATAGATAATVEALTDTEIVTANELFKVAGSNQGYRVTNGPQTVATTKVVITFSPALDVGIVDTAVVTFQKSGWRNMAFNKNAFALATANLAPPLGGASSAALTDPKSGLSIRVVYDYTLSSKSNTMSFDTLVGVKTLNADMAAILCDAN